MERPDIAFKDWLYANWNTATAGILKANMTFQNTDWSDAQIIRGKPVIVVKLAGFRRMQEAEPSLHKFTLLVEVGIHSPSVQETETKRALQWSIVEYLKGLLDDFVKDSITGWHWALISSMANLDAVELQPEAVISNLSVEAVAEWTVA